MCILLFVILVISSVLCQDYYDRRYDYFDVETLVQNPRLLKKYMDCFLDQGPCTPVGRVFKRKLRLFILKNLNPTGAYCLRWKYLYTCVFCIVYLVLVLDKQLLYCLLLYGMTDCKIDLKRSSACTHLVLT